MNLGRTLIDIDYQSLINDSIQEFESYITAPDTAENYAAAWQVYNRMIQNTTLWGMLTAAQRQRLLNRLREKEERTPISVDENGNVTNGTPAGSMYDLPGGIGLKLSGKTFMIPGIDKEIPREAVYGLGILGGLYYLMRR